MTRQGASPLEVYFLKSLWWSHKVTLTSSVLLKEMNQLWGELDDPTLQKSCHSYKLNSASWECQKKQLTSLSRQPYFRARGPPAIIWANYLFYRWKLKFRETQFSIQLLKESQHSKLQVSSQFGHYFPDFTFPWPHSSSFSVLATPSFWSFLEGAMLFHTSVLFLCHSLVSFSPYHHLSGSCLPTSIHPSRICLTISLWNFPNEVKCSLCNTPLELLNH